MRQKTPITNSSPGLIDTKKAQQLAKAINDIPENRMFANSATASSN
jgi:hypothetical protein